MRKFLFASVGAIALLTIMSLSGGQPGVQADTSSMDWDMSLTDVGPTGNDPVCASDADGNIETGECPEMSSHYFIDTKDATSNEAFFDLGTQIWRTGGPGADVDGDTIPEPADGIAQYAGAALTHATTVGRVAFYIKNNVDPAFIGAGNINTVTGQPPLCGTTTPGFFQPSPFYLWKATTNNAQTVSHQDTSVPPDGKPQTQENNFTVGACGVTGPDGNKIPDGVDCTPIPIPTIQATIGLPLANYIGRSFGIANLPIFPPLVYNPVDVNFLSYNMVSVPEVGGYVQFTVVLYPGAPGTNPALNPTSVTGQTVDTCPPYYTSPVNVFGITADSDFDGDAVTDLVTPNQKNRQVIGTGGPYNSFIFKSAEEDWDGDTIASHYDRCPWDPASGTLAQDTDGDHLTGLCETLGAGNGEGTNPLPGGPNTAIPWDAGQDVDGDNYINFADNCAIIADADVTGDTVVDYNQDTDGDTVGDVCEMAPGPAAVGAPETGNACKNVLDDDADTVMNDGCPRLLGTAVGAELVPGDGWGYPKELVGDMVQSVKSAGKLVDRDNVCTDPFTIPSAEPTLDSGRLCLGFDAVGRPYGPLASGISKLDRVVVDSNDDADPDLLDWPAGAPIEWMDTNTDADGDGDTDACEAWMGTDPLDASVSPASPAGDCDSDAATDSAEETAGTNPFPGDPDADRDGCPRSQENPTGTAARPGKTAAGGVSFQDQAWYDFFDVPVPSLRLGAGTYSGTVGMGDVLAILDYSGVAAGALRYEQDLNANGVRDGLEYDRSPSALPSPPWDAGPPSGAVGMPDVLGALAQSGLACVGGSHF